MFRKGNQGIQRGGVTLILSHPPGNTHLPVLDNTQRAELSPQDILSQSIA